MSGHEAPSLPFAVAIAGPTGVGKTALSLELARREGGEIVNYDSVQLYRGFDIGSAKPSLEERSTVPHHLFDVVEADGPEMNAAEYQRAVDVLLRDLGRRGALPILVGGTFFYLRAILTGLPEMPGRNDEIRERIARLWDRPRGRARLARILSIVDPVSHSRIAEADRYRRERALEVWFASGRPISSWQRPTARSAPRIEHILVALHLPRELLVERLDARVVTMYRDGLIEETERLLSRYPSTARPFTSIGYAEAVRFLKGESTRDEAIAETQRRSRAYAKRQMTWLRAEPRAIWIPALASSDAICGMISEKLDQRRKQLS